MTLHQSVRIPLAAGLLLLAVVMPFAASALDHEFYVGVLTRIMIFGIVATSLNLLIGFGGMVCFGHAAFFGLGGYAVGILAHHGFHAAWLAWPLAMLVAALAAAIIGAISLRTHGVYFIMITLAFAQMLHYMFVSLADYGGDDGLPISQRSSMTSGLDLSQDTVFYYVVLALLLTVLAFVQSLVNSRFGRVLQATKENEQRTEAIGFPVFRYKLIAFVIAGAIAGLGGALIANQNGMVSPSLMFWTQSGALMVMVIVGGVGYVYGGILGAFILLLLEEILATYTIYWQLPLGVLLLGIVIFSRNGIASLLSRRQHD
ncbi:branched-chain amino acid ABC transporter permease [Variovorax sp. Sphag1AA]|uniref:branched-chain amino acid ABC transporter permease n=1 Tax=Variovorax sp. Sphag1AA TaxID=2587027 RepID=UPI00161CF5FE|nr:branched-chain amino acid ABC transporter permease [Variovorax sp. Sphag1AA]MBB3182451.1 branched-chain amino acid transport system permease protein [Variovorax sp. Sphag1AA]